MKPSLAAAMTVTALCLAASASQAASQKWLKCSLTRDVVRDGKGGETVKALTGSVIFVIDDDNQAFFAYGEDSKVLTKLSADVRPRQITFYDGPLSDTINRVTGTFDVVASPFHEAHGSCVPIEPIMTAKPKF